MDYAIIVWKDLIIIVLGLDAVLGKEIISKFFAWKIYLRYFYIYIYCLAFYAIYIVESSIYLIVKET